MKAVIMAGGLGTRLCPLTKVLPKPLLPLGEMPIIEIIIRQMVHRGFVDITIIVRYKANLIRTLLGDGHCYGANISYIMEEEAAGTIGSLALLKDGVEPVMLINADILTDVDYYQLYQSHLHSQANVSIMLVQKEQQIDYGVIEVSRCGEVRSYKEKPKHEYLVSAGVYVLEAASIAMIDAPYMDMPQFINRCIRTAGIKVNGFIHKGYWKDIGTLLDFEDAISDFADRQHVFLS